MRGIIIDRSKNQRTKPEDVFTPSHLTRRKRPENKGTPWVIGGAVAIVLMSSGVVYAMSGDEKPITPPVSVKVQHSKKTAIKTIETANKKENEAEAEINEDTTLQDTRIKEEPKKKKGSKIPSNKKQVTAKRTIAKTEQDSSTNNSNKQPANNVGGSNNHDSSQDDHDQNNNGGSNSNDNGNGNHNNPPPDNPPNDNPSKPPSDEKGKNWWEDLFRW